MLSGGKIYHALNTFSRRVILTFLIQPQMTQVILQLLLLLLPFFFTDTSLRFHDLTDGLCEHQTKITNSSTGNNLFFYKKMPINQSTLNKHKLTFPQMTDVEFTERSRSHSCDQCTRSGRKNVGSSL